MHQIPKKGQQDSLILTGDMIHHPTSKLPETVMAKITCKAKPSFPNGDKERKALCEMTIFCVVKK